MAVSASSPTKEEEKEEKEHLEEDRFVPSQHPSALPDELRSLVFKETKQMVVSTLPPTKEEEEEGEPEHLEEDRFVPSHHPSALPDELRSLVLKETKQMAVSALPPTKEEEEGEPEHLEEDRFVPSNLPSALPNELFDLSTTVSLISLIRKLLPSRGEKNAYVSAGEEVWEECGCVLWDLAANQTHAELMAQNLVLEVLSGNLMVRQSFRVTEICLGIMGNLACHEVLMKRMVSTNGLIAVIVAQLFLDDTRCLCLAFRLLGLGLRSTEFIKWADALQSKPILNRILCITENTLNPRLAEKSVGLLLVVLQRQKEVEHILLTPLMKLGLPTVLINLLAYEMRKLTNERKAERYSVLEVILLALQALSVIDGYSQEISSNKEFFQLVCDLIKFPDKVEVSNSCVTAGVLIANILSDVSDVASEISQDLGLLQGLFDILPFTSNDLEAWCALWTSILRVLVRVREDQIHQYVFLLLSKSDLIEDNASDDQFDKKKENESLATCCRTSSARTSAFRRIISILNNWNASVQEKNENYENMLRRLLDCCHKYTK